MASLSSTKVNVGIGRKLISSNDFDIIVKEDPDTITENVPLKSASTLAFSTELSRSPINKG